MLLLNVEYNVCVCVEVCGDLKFSVRIKLKER